MWRSLTSKLITTSNFKRQLNLNLEILEINVVSALQELHRQYMAGVADMRKDVQFILKATSMLMAGCMPVPAAAAA